jgi:hypothetical protein
MATPISSALAIPDSPLAKEATEILRQYSTDLLYNHSVRVYLFAAEQGRERKLRFDPELLYVAAAFHDFGLLKNFSSPDERFEVDSANAARPSRCAGGGIRPISRGGTRGHRRQIPAHQFQKGFH